ncbi:MAG: 1-acyl-sn-glycerol-3-phosphate acyltransferase [Gammaproteobacteria bacterium]|nr:1-acyl-sn-glycerol-3-phosphate acyltransferase [Gammaproteobacteria bacterium]
MLRDRLVSVGAPRVLDTLASAWFQVEFLGEEHLQSLREQPVMLVMNHTAFFALEVYLLGNRILRHYPELDLRTLVWKGFTQGPAGVWFRGLGCETASIARGRELLAAGKTVLIMPEGVGATDVRNRLKTFRTGYLRMLEETPVPIIPIGFHGVDEAMPWIVARNRFLEERLMKPVDPNFDFVLFPRLPLMRPSKIVFSIGAPITLNSADLASEERIRRTNMLIRQRVSALMHEAEYHRSRRIHGSTLNRWWHRAVEGRTVQLSPR